MAAITTDGSDIDGCSNVVVHGCDFDAEDDAICLTSTDRLCENVLVENCRVRSSCYGLKMGTASHGGFRRITVRDLRIRDTYRSAVTSQSVDGGHIEDIDVSDIVAENTGNTFFIRITMPDGADPAVAYISLDELHRVSDFPERYPEFAMFGELPAWVLCLRHTRGIVLRQSHFDLRFPDFRPAPVLDTSVDTTLDGISLDLKSGRPLIAAHDSPGVRILNPSQPLGKGDLRQWKTELAAQ